MTRTVLSLGSNLGDRMARLRSAIEGLRRFIPAVSGVYETAPWGDPDQPAYLNAVAIVSQPMATPRDWLDRAQELERAAGRTRDPERPLGPRELDVDVIAVWDGNRPVFLDEPDFIVPHPRAHLRAFVLVPWLEIEPEAVLPGRGPVTDLLRTGPAAKDVGSVKASGRLR